MARNGQGKLLTAQQKERFKIAFGEGGEVTAATAAASSVFAPVADLLEDAINGTQTVTKTLTSAQLLALNATPITIIPAPPAGQVVLVRGCLAYYFYGGTAYTIGTNAGIGLKYTNGSGQQVLKLATTGFVDQAADKLEFATADATQNGYLVVAAAPIVAQALTAELTNGNGTVKLTVLFNVVSNT